MLIDSHVHVGRYDEEYFTPALITELMRREGVDYYAVSSTTQCAEDYTGVLKELDELMRLDSDRVLPVMWITPAGLEGNIAWYLESGIKWRMLKIHPFLNKEEWQVQPALFDEVTDIAREMELPVLIHTGNDDCCRCPVFEKMIADNHDINFILAHGRPIDQAIKMARNYKNAYVDSAFMPVDEMKLIVESGLSHKLLWGTDMCIPKYFDPDIDLASYYNNKVNSFRECCPEEAFKRVTFENAAKLFNLKV